MGRFRQRMYEEYSKEFTEDDRFKAAYNRVKRIKGFYVHTLVYVLVNAFIIIPSFNRNVLSLQDFWNWETFYTALFWGIGLLVHGISVFGQNIFFGQKWEENKIKELMEKDKQNIQKWN
jgi:hypothetical protein